MIVPLHAGNPGHMTGSGNWTYLLPGRHTVLLDAGVGMASHLDAIAAARPEGPGRVLVSHGHVDHIAGVGALGARWPALSFAKFPWPDRDERYPAAWQWLGDGDVVPAGDDELVVIHTPGHAPDHVAFWHASSRTLFSGDLVVAGTSVVIPASAGGSLSAYLASLARVLELGPRRLLPAHGPAIENPAETVHGYIAHRRQREAQILDALAAGLTSAEAMVARIYPELTPALLPMARESVLAHLLKLEDEGRILRDQEAGWALPW